MFGRWYAVAAIAVLFIVTTGVGAVAATDNDGLAYPAEMKHNSSPFNSDTDGDGLDDGVEVMNEASQ